MVHDDSLEDGVVALDESVTDDGKVVAVGVLDVLALDGTGAHAVAGLADVEVGGVEVEVTDVGEVDADRAREVARVVVRAVTVCARAGDGGVEGARGRGGDVEELMSDQCNAP